MLLKDLLERRARIAAEMRAIAADPKGECGDLSEEQETRFEELKTELATVEKRIEQQQLIDAAERRMDGQQIAGTGDERLDQEVRNFSVVRAIASHLPDAAVDAGREREISQEIARRSGGRFQGMAVPLQVFEVERRVITSTLPADGAGGNVIPTQLAADQYIDILRAKLIVRGLGARIISGLMGNVDIPRRKASGTAQWVAENAAISASDQKFEQVPLRPKHVGDITEFSRNMLLQSSPDIEQLVRDDLAAVLAEAIDRAAINGGGTNEPDGVLQTTGIGDVDLSTVTWAKVLEIIADVETANSEGTGWATNPKVVKLLRSTLKETGDAGAGYIMDGPRQLAGFPAAVSTVVPDNLGVGTDESQLIFGKWNDLIVGYWSVFDLLVNPYESTAYSKGNVQVRAMITADVAVRQPASFSAGTAIAAG